MNQTWSEVSMRGVPCSPIHQKDKAPNTANGASPASAVPYGVRTSVQTMGYESAEYRAADVEGGERKAGRGGRETADLSRGAVEYGGRCGRIHILVLFLFGPLIS
jgi:hypothetical protein